MAFCAVCVTTLHLHGECWEDVIGFVHLFCVYVMHEHAMRPLSQAYVSDDQGRFEERTGTQTEVCAPGKLR